MLKIKLFAVAAFLAVAACAFLFSNNRSLAQSEKNRDDILQKVAGYKTWKQIVKPEKKIDEPSIILNSTGMG